MPPMAVEETLRAYRAQVQAELTGNILPFYADHVVDAVHGGFHGYVENDCTARTDAPRGVIQVARILWTFAHTSRLLGDDAWLPLADRAYSALAERFVDQVNGGVYWMTDPHGRPLDAKKLVYAQAFAIYACAEYARATGNRAAMTHAQTFFDWVERLAWDGRRMGYVEGLTRQGAPDPTLRVDTVSGPVAFSMNTHLHLLEAYTTLYAVWPDRKVASALRRCLDIVVKRVINPQSGHFGLQFDAAWQPLDDRVSYGHDIEGSWLIIEAADSLDDGALVAQVSPAAMRLVRNTYVFGRDADGGLFNEGGPEGVRERSKDWWPQAEAMVGFLNGFQIEGDARYLDASLAAWRYVRAQIIDPVHGEWYWGRDAHGAIVPQQKSGPWKGPYHNGRACMEIMQRVDQLLQAPVHGR